MKASLVSTFLQKMSSARCWVKEKYFVRARPDQLVYSLNEWKLHCESWQNSKCGRTGCRRLWNEHSWPGQGVCYLALWKKPKVRNVPNWSKTFFGEEEDNRMVRGSV